MHVGNAVFRSILDNVSGYWNWILAGIFVAVLGITIRSANIASDYSNLVYTMSTGLISFGILIVLGCVFRPTKREGRISQSKIHEIPLQILNNHELAEAYHADLSEDKREYDRLIFALPTAASAIDGAILTVAYAYVEEPIPRLVLLLIAMLLTFSIIIQNIKHRYFSDIITENLIVLEHHLGWAVQRVTTSDMMSRITKSEESTLRIETKKPSGLERISAHMAIRNAIVVVFLLLVVLSIRELLLASSIHLVA